MSWAILVIIILLLRKTTLGGAKLSGVGFSINNPGNLKHYSGRGYTWNGEIGITERNFIIFESYETGLRAMIWNLRTSYRDHKLRTVNSIINRWAPSFSQGGDNSELQQLNYKKFVSNRLGLSMWDFFDWNEENVFRVIAGMEYFENDGQKITRSFFNKVWNKNKLWSLQS